MNSQILVCIVSLCDKNKTILSIKIEEQVKKILQLKQQIYSQNKILETQKMCLMSESKQLQDNQLLNSYFNLAVNGQLKIYQKKQSLNKIKDLTVVQEIDPLGMDEIVVRMPCGHVIGTEGMVCLLNNLIETKKPQIRCQYKTQNTPYCHKQWDFSLCAKVGVLTSQQRAYFAQELSKILFFQNTTECPNCEARVSTQNIEQNRARCLKCSSPDYCVQCFQPWKNEGNILCGNQGCRNVLEALKQSPLTKQFNLIDQSKNPPLPIKIKTPALRACPQCYNIIYHTQGCTCLTCNKCKAYFCWVCLSISRAACHGSNYCGKTAPNQDFTILKQKFVSQK